MITVGNEKFTFKLYRRKENTPYEYEDTPYATFNGRPANQYEKKTYRLMQGVNSNSDSQFIICSNLPEGIKPKDKIIFLGQQKLVESIGYYFDQARFINPGIFSEDYILQRCPKGIAIQ